MIGPVFPCWTGPKRGLPGRVSGGRAKAPAQIPCAGALKSGPAFPETSLTGRGRLPAMHAGMMAIRRNLLLACLSAAILPLLSACGDEAAAPPVAIANDDPLIDAVLADRLLTDSDMASRNGANTVASFAAIDGSIPFPDAGPELVAAARAQAFELVGGTAGMRHAPEADDQGDALPAEASLSVAARAALSGDSFAQCAAQSQFSAVWAARMPQALPVYPLGAVTEAAGFDGPSCRLRAVNFTTPVPLSEVIDFYYSSAEAAGYTTRRSRRGNEDVLGGSRNGASFMLFARAREDGRSEIDLVTLGG